MRADLIQCWKMLSGNSLIITDDLLDCPPQEQTRGHRHKMFPTIARTDVRKCFFTVQCINAWNALPADVVCSSSLAIFKKKLDVCLYDALNAYV